MQRALAIALGLLLTLGAAGCSGKGDIGFQDSRPEFMQELKSRLAASGIPFREDSEGFVRYASEHATAVDQIKDRIEKDMSGGIAWKVDDPASRDYLTELLSSMGRKHWVQSRTDGEWVLWHPQSEAEMLEVQMKFVRFRFEARQNEPR